MAILESEGISSRMPIACSVGLTYSYFQGHAKYLSAARKLSSRFFCILYKGCARHGFRDNAMRKIYSIIVLLVASVTLFAQSDVTK